MATMTDAQPSKAAALTARAKALAGVWRRRRLDVATTTLDLAGMGTVAAGVGMTYRPAGVIVAGLAMLAVSWRAAR